MGKLYVYVCGKTRVKDERGQLVEKLGGVKPRQVLEILALSLGRPVSKDRIAQLLWDGAPPPSYVGTLESYVCLLRRAIGSKGRDSALQTTTTGYVLRAERVGVDIIDAQTMLVRARLAPAPEKVALVERALALLDEELLASEPYAPWAQAQREAHGRDMASWCVEAGESVLELGETGLAWRLGRLVTDQDQFMERAWQLKMRALVQEGRQAEALSTYARLRGVMIDELGAEPSETSRRLYAQVLESYGSGQRRESDHHEVSALIRLLRQALDSLPGIQASELDANLDKMALRLVAAA